MDGQPPKLREAGRQARVGVVVWVLEGQVRDLHVAVWRDEGAQEGDDSVGDHHEDHSAVEGAVARGVVAEVRAVVAAEPLHEGRRPAMVHHPAKGNEAGSVLRSAALQCGYLPNPSTRRYSS